MKQQAPIDPQLERALKRVVASYLPPGAARDDLAQEVALAVHLALPRFRGESSLRTYLLRTAHNVCLRQVTRQRARHAQESPEQATPDPRPSPEARLATKQREQRLLAAVRQLPISQRQVITLALEELTGPEIAAVLGISDNAVHIRLHRARHALASLLEKP